jgi:hypothetical protein
MLFIIAGNPKARKLLKNAAHPLGQVHAVLGAILGLSVYSFAGEMSVISCFIFVLGSFLAKLAIIWSEQFPIFNACTQF